MKGKESYGGISQFNTLAEQLSLGLSDAVPAIRHAYIFDNQAQVDTAVFAVRDKAVGDKGKGCRRRC